MSAVSDPIFSDDFHSFPIKEVLTQIEDKGYFSYTRALRPDFVQQIVGELGGERLNVNRNDVSPVILEYLLCFTHAMAWSQRFFELVTHPFILDIAQARLGSEFRLKAQRYYETQDKHVMQWHSDAKTDKDFANIRGLVFLLYLCDVEDGELQYVAGSHKWSGALGINYFENEFIAGNHSAEVVGFKLPAGSVMIYDTYGIHRAKPIVTRGFTRKSILFQIDRELRNGEKILVNTAFLKQWNARLSMYLGFGQKAEYQSCPQTDMRTLTLKDLRVLQWKISGAFAYKAAQEIYRKLPTGLRGSIRQLFKRDA